MLDISLFLFCRNMQNLFIYLQPKWLKIDLINTHKNNLVYCSFIFSALKANQLSYEECTLSYWIAFPEKMLVIQQCLLQHSIKIESLKSCSHHRVAIESLHGKQK